MVWKEHSTLITIERANLTITYIAMKQLSTICKVSKVLMLHNLLVNGIKLMLPNNAQGCLLFRCRLPCDGLPCQEVGSSCQGIPNWVLSWATTSPGWEMPFAASAIQIRRSLLQSMLLI